MNITSFPKSMICKFGNYLENNELSFFLRSCKKLNNYRKDSMIQQVFCMNAGFLTPYETNETWNDTYDKLKHGYTLLVRDSLKFNEITFIPLDIDSVRNLDPSSFKQAITIDEYEICDSSGQTMKIYEDENFIYYSDPYDLIAKENKIRRETTIFSIEGNEDISFARNICLLNKGKYALSLNYSYHEGDKKFYVLLLDLEENKLVKIFTVDKSLTSFRVTILSNLKEVFMAYDENIYLKMIFSENPDHTFFEEKPAN